MDALRSVRNNQIIAVTLVLREIIVLPHLSDAVMVVTKLFSSQLAFVRSLQTKLGKVVSYCIKSPTYGSVGNISFFSLVLCKRNLITF